MFLWLTHCMLLTTLCECAIVVRIKSNTGSGKHHGTNNENGDWSGPWNQLNQSEIASRSNEYRIKYLIFSHYQKSCRPVFYDESTIRVTVGLTLFHIINTDEKHQTLSALVSVRLRWKDNYLTWNKTDFDNVSTIWIPSDYLWRPDIVIANYAGTTPRHGEMNTNAIVTSEGDVLWMYPTVIKVYCLLDVRYFPFDYQKCVIKYFSWTFSGFQLDLHQDDNPNRVMYNPTNQEWFIDNITAHRHEQLYICCPNEPFPEVLFTINMRRRSLFYVINLIFPCFLLYLVSIVGFFLPIQSGDKINIEITILLALVVFLMIAGEVLPPTPDVVPILGLFYGATMLMVTLALIMAVIVTNLYRRDEKKRPIPHFVARFFRSFNQLCDRMQSLPLTIRHRLNRFRQRTNNKKFDNFHNHNHEQHEPMQSDANHLILMRSVSLQHNKGSSLTESDDGKEVHDTHEIINWPKVAQHVDKIFFYTFVFISVFIYIVIFQRGAH